MPAFTRILSNLVLLGLLALPTVPHPTAAESQPIVLAKTLTFSWPQSPAGEIDPAILATVDAAIAAINSGSVADAKEAFAETPAAIVDAFPPFLWSGKNAVEDYIHDLKANESNNTDWRYQRSRPRYLYSTEDRAYLVVPIDNPFLTGGKPQNVSADYTFVLTKIDGKWRITVTACGNTYDTTAP